MLTEATLTLTKTVKIALGMEAAAMNAVELQQDDNEIQRVEHHNMDPNKRLERMLLVW